MVKSTASQEELDTLIPVLIQQVVESTDGSQPQKEAMNKLLRLIPKLSGIYKHHDPRIDYQDAFNQALEGISIYQEHVSGRNLRSFLKTSQLNLNQAASTVVRANFVKWCNGIIRKKIIDQHRKQSKLPLSLDAPVQLGEETTREEIVPDIRTLGDLDSWSARAEKEKIRLKGYLLERYIELDPDGKLQSSYPLNCSECHCQLLLTEEYLKEQGEAVSSMAKRFGMRDQTIYSHRKRRCLALLREITGEIDTNFDEYARRLIGD